MMPTTSPSSHGPASGEHALDVIAALYGRTPSAVLSLSRDPLLVEARRVLYAILRDQGMSFSAIGRLAHRDHSTVMHHLYRLRDQPTPEEEEMLADARKALAPVPDRGTRP